MDTFRSPIPSPFFGFDRVVAVPIQKTDSPKVVEAYLKGQVWKNPFVRWMQELYNRSNFSLTGIYLESRESNEREYPTPAVEIGRGWTIYYDQFSKQGWGSFFIYATYSLSWEQNPDTKESKVIKVNRFPDNLLSIAEDRAKLHGKQIKRIVHGFANDSTGSVVYIDNEGAGMPESLAVYLSFLFKEMSTLGDDGLPPVRPGLYCHSITATRLLFTVYAKLFKDFTDLFLWLIVSTTPQDPFTSDPTKVEFNASMRPIWVCNSVGGRAILPVGEQTVLNFAGTVPHSTKRVDASVSAALPSLRTWDFCSSFIRDPRYPQAYPRFSIQRNVLICGVFNKSDTSMSLEERFPTTGPIDSTSSKVEPEAPLLLTTSLDLFTLNFTGQVVTSRRNDQGGWSPLAPLPSTSSDPTLRRLRAMTAISPEHKDPQLFYISSDYKVYARRKPSGQDWTAPKLLASGILAYYFSTITSTTGYSSILAPTTEVFFIDASRVLQCAAASFPATNDWPGDQHIAIDSQPVETTHHNDVSDEDEIIKDTGPALLPGTALVAISPSRLYTLIFGIAKNYTLYMATRDNKTQTWLPLAPVVTQPGNFFLLPHGKLAAFSPTPKTVLVAGFTQAGVPCTFNLRFDDTSWTCIGTWTQYRRFGGKTDPLEQEFRNIGMESHPEVAAVANAWNFNPYGDITLALEAPEVVLTVPASLPGKAGLMKRRITKPDEAWWLVDDKGKWIPPGGP